MRQSMDRVVMAGPKESRTTTNNIFVRSLNTANAAWSKPTNITPLNPPVFGSLPIKNYEFRGSVSTLD